MVRFFTQESRLHLQVHKIGKGRHTYNAKIRGCGNLENSRRISKILLSLDVAALALGNIKDDSFSAFLSTCCNYSLCPTVCF